MTISEQVEEVVSRESEKNDNKNGLERFRELQAEIEKIGFAQKQEYTLPPLDTIGRKVFEGTTAKASKR